MFWKQKEELIVGKDEPDLHWDGIEGLSYNATSEFAKKYVPPLVDELKTPKFEKVVVNEKKHSQQQQEPQEKEQDKPNNNYDINKLPAKSNETDIFIDDDGASEEYTFTNEQQPPERAVRYSQSATIANVLY